MLHNLVFYRNCKETLLQQILQGFKFLNFEDKGLTKSTKVLYLLHIEKIQLYSNFHRYLNLFLARNLRESSISLKKLTISDHREEKSNKNQIGLSACRPHK